jgi:hypothetical protein
MPFCGSGAWKLLPRRAPTQLVVSGVLTERMFYCYVKLRGRGVSWGESIIAIKTEHWC